jgi:hypothetical protein
MRLHTFLAAAGLLLALVGAARAESIVVTSTALPLNRDNLVQLRVGALRYAGGLELTSDNAKFGGLSGLLVAADGQSFTAVSDRGLWFTGRITRDAQGGLVGVADTALFPIRDRDGDPVAIRTQTHDAESLAREGDTLIVGFERRHRLWRYDAGNLETAKAEALPTPPGLIGARINGGIEALAVLGPGRYLAVAEELETPDGNLRGWLFDDGVWRELAYEQQPGWKPTDFTLLPDGDVLATERHFTRMGGFTSQLRRIPRALIAPGALLQGKVIAEFAAPILTDNFEGLANFRGGDGHIYLLVVSDNNFTPLQRTVLLQFRLEAED